MSTLSYVITFHEILMLSFPNITDWIVSLYSIQFIWVDSQQLVALLVYTAIAMYIASLIAA